MTGRERPAVVMIRVQCNNCRRRRAAALNRAALRGERGERPATGLCPHYRDVFAPGYGPGSPGRPWGESLPPV